MIRPQPLQGSVGDLSYMLRAAIQAELAELLAEGMTELGRDHDLVSERGKGLADNFLILVGSVCLGGIEEGDAMVDGSADQLDRILCVGCGTISGAKPHASEPDG